MMSIFLLGYVLCDCLGLVVPLPSLRVAPFRPLALDTAVGFAWFA